ncbi:hypothetical protein [Acidocella sp.]|uniref:hypothetical protein n=1 Tax=Acidocella sp. TaxID=50710 RepID=UPI0026157B8E|nr:hypothetical protein [Acidocella sp.]
MTSWKERRVTGSVIRKPMQEVLLEKSQSGPAGFVLNKRQSMGDQLYGQILEQITSGRLP